MWMTGIMKDIEIDINSIYDCFQFCFDWVPEKRLINFLQRINQTLEERILRHSDYLIHRKYICISIYNCARSENRNERVKSSILFSVRNFLLHILYEQRKALYMNWFRKNDWRLFFQKPLHLKCLIKIGFLVLQRKKVMTIVILVIKNLINTLPTWVIFLTFDSPLTLSYFGD